MTYKHAHIALLQLADLNELYIRVVCRCADRAHAAELMIRGFGNYRRIAHAVKAHALRAQERIDRAVKLVAIQHAHKVFHGLNGGAHDLAGYVVRIVIRIHVLIQI